MIFLTGCAISPERIQPGPREVAVTDPAWPGASFVLWQPCTTEHAEQLAARAKGDARDAVRGASCFAVLSMQSKKQARKLAYAKQGRELAELAAAKFPESGLAHYLVAYLTGLEAENDPLRGLGLVKKIEREALLAARLNPVVDNGGPDRMLGELYLRAPAFPTSVGDVTNSIDHYRRAVEEAPGFLENRLGLAQALLADEQLGPACSSLRECFANMTPSDSDKEIWLKSLQLMKKLCSEQKGR